MNTKLNYFFLVRLSFNFPDFNIGSKSCREFVLDLRTKYFDGTFDIIDLPFGYGNQKVGLSLLIKRSYPVIDRPINEICGSLSSPDEIEINEVKWLNSEIEKNSNSESIHKKISLEPSIIKLSWNAIIPWFESLG